LSADIESPAVLRTTVTADENSSVDAVVGDLRTRCESNGLSLPSIELLTGQVREILTPLVANGRKLAAQGSQLNVTRDINVDGYSVRLIFGAGLPQTTWRKFVKRFFGT
jgi:hypothetical protein